MQKPIINFDMHILARLKPFTTAFFIGKADIVGSLTKSTDTIDIIGEMAINIGYKLYPNTPLTMISAVLWPLILLKICSIPTIKDAMASQILV
ncbi:MAG: hypothetical protein LBJ95_05285 [Oscillospiraceae bacterium]|nr:hypothetical protein [Oscillospiraceae bacterium]